MTAGGYIEVWVPLDSPFRSMAGKDGYVYEHRLVMAGHVQRPLTREELVHHVNADKQDNNVSNLRLTSRAAHSAAHHAEIVTLRARVKELEREVAQLQASAP